MAAKVFISCGQASGHERAAAAKIAQDLESNGFRTYVAIQAQSIEDVNSGIVGNLKRSDYYVFVDFKRDNVSDGARGSLFTNQELAMAYILGFERVLFFQQTDVRLEGLLAYMGSNAAKFNLLSELPALVTSAFTVRHWTPDYSRHLLLGPLRWSDTLIKFDELLGRFLYVDVQNQRFDLAAYDTVARLDSINGLPCPERSHLKVTGQPGYTQIIWPRNHGAFDLLEVDVRELGRVYLNSALDVWPKQPVIEGAGLYRLDYSVLARQFPILYFTVELKIGSDPMNAMAALVSVDSGA